MTGELNLWEAVMMQAIEDLAGSKLALGSHQEVARNQNDARSWFFSDDHDVGGFLYICDTLSVDPGAIRRGLRSRSPAEIHRSLRHRNGQNIRRPFVAGVDNPAFDCTTGRRVLAAL